MSTLAKKEWNQRVSIEDALGCSIQWLTKARQKNILAPSPPTLYMAYVVEDAPYLGFMKDYGSVFRYSTKDDPENDRARDVALRLLAVAVKAHFFLDKDALCRHEPYLFSIPDISSPSTSHYGIVYRIESRPAKTIICATCDMGSVSTLRPDAFRFPVVLTKNSYKWFDKKHWTGLAQEADVFERIMKPWVAKQELDVAEKWTDPETFQFGTILDVPFDIKDYIKPTGAKWSDGMRKWFLPKGFDVEPVKEYIQWIAHQHKDNRDNLEAVNWRSTSAKRPKTSASGKQAGSGRTDPAGQSD